MRRTLLLFWLLFGLTEGSVFNGGIETVLSIDMEGGDIPQDEVWTRNTLWLKMGKTIPSGRCYGRIRLYTDEEMGFHIQPKEAYIDYYGKRFDLRGGLQQILWGTAYKLNPTSVINPYDLSEKIFHLPEERLGVASFKVDYYPISHLSLTGVYIPYFLPALRKLALLDTLIEIPLPPRTPGNSEYALKANLQSILGSDISLSYFKGMDDFPSLKGYQQIRVYGGDLITTLAGFTFWAEGAYKTPEDGDSTLDIAAGGEYTFGNNLYLMGQFYRGDMVDFRGDFFMAVGRYPIFDRDTLELGIAYEATNKTYIFLPKVILSLADAFSITLSSVLIKAKPEEGILNQLRNVAILEISYSF